MGALVRRGRGQLLIITAISLAVLLVLMALALNTAVYGVVHSAGASDDVGEERTAVRYEDGVQRGVAGLISRVNETTAPDYAALRSNLSRAVTNWSRTAGRTEARDGVATNASLAEARFETVVVHDDQSRQFTNRSGATNWTVAEGFTDVDAYEMRIDRSRLVNTSECAAGDACFEVAVDGGGWRLTAHRADEKVVVRVDTPDADAKCETTDPSVTVNATNGSFDTAGCAGETFTPVTAAVDAPYQIRYENGDNVDGVYELRGEGQVDEEDFYGPNTSESPRFTPRLVAADVTVTYRSPDLHYSTVLRVESGDADA